MSQVQDGEPVTGLGNEGSHRVRQGTMSGKTVPFIFAALTGGSAVH